jgi:signal transduction histidine kinase
MSGTVRRSLRGATIAVVLVIAAIAVIGTVATYHGARSEEHDLLKERASEIGLILTDAFSSLQSQLQTTAAETALNGASASAFRAAVTAIFPDQPGASTALARVTGTSVRYLAVAGTLPATPGPANAALIRRALTTEPKPLVVSAASGEGATRTLGLAYPVGTGNLAIYREFSLNPQTIGAAATQGQQPFEELSVALYAAATPDPSSLVITTQAATLTGGSVARATAPFGADTWLVLIKARSPLEGTFAANTYWIVLGGGLVLAVVIGALAEALARRRDYALALVDERTAELETSVSKLEQAQDQLLRQERLAAIGELASAVGHELRNPLGVITNAHYLLRAQLEKSGGTESTARHLTTAEREVGAATLIVSDLLDFARAREPVTAPVDVAELIDEVEDVIPPPAGITIRRETASAVPAALADRDQLRQVVLNLVTNAYEAMPDGGVITIGAAVVDDRVRVTVTDPGLGMDAETAARVFEPFFTRKARGIGLGLAVTKRIVDSHNGTITVTTAPGAGTTFTVDLPVADAESAR